MRRALVVFYSETGNTERVAHVIAKGLKEDDIRVSVKRVEKMEPSEVREYSMICIGSPVHYFAPAKPIRSFMAKLPDLSGKLAAVFCTYGGICSKRSLNQMKSLLETKGAKVIGEHRTVGVVHHGPLVFRRGRPNASDLELCEEFGRKLALYRRRGKGRVT